MIILWFGGIAGGFLLAGHEPRVNNFLTATGAGGTGTGATTEAAAATQKAPGGGSLIVVWMEDFKFVPNQITAPAGKITFRLQNRGRYTHDFRIHLPGGQSVESGRIGAGFQHDFTVTLKAGTYDFDCSVSNHAKRGMVGKLVVK